MKTNSVKNDNNTVTVTATFDQAEWQKECKAALKNLAGRAQIKGFRNGRVPAAMIKKVYGEAAIEETAAEKMSRQHLDAIIEEADVEPIDRISFDGFEVNDEGVALTFTVPVAPEAKLGQWKNLGIKKDEVTVTDEDVENAIKDRQKKAAESELVEDGAIEEGDDVAVTVKDGNSEVKKQLVIGAGADKTVEDALLGMKTGEEKDVENTDAEGNVTTLHLTVGDVFRDKLPLVNDEFAKAQEDLDKPETVDAMKETLRTRMQEARENAAEEKFIGELLKAVGEKADVEIPESMIRNETNYQINRLASQFGNMDNFMNFLSQAGIEPSALAGQFYEESRMRVLNTLVLDAIAREAGLEVTDEEVDAEIEDFAKANNAKVEDILKNVNREEVKHSLLHDKAVEALEAAQGEEAAAE